jgi:hypothetical protein
MKKTILFFCVIVLSITNLSAKYTQTCQVKYYTQDGWSKYYSVDVNFLSGQELNDATNSFNYSSFSTYAVIFWGQSNASIIKISTFTGCGSVVNKSCITNIFSDIKGYAQNGVEWKICVGNMCY